MCRSGKTIACIAALAENVNEPQTGAESEVLRKNSQKGAPFGVAEWTETMATALGLESTLRARGRPSKLNDGGFRFPHLIPIDIWVSSQHVR